MHCGRGGRHLLTRLVNMRAGSKAWPPSSAGNNMPATGVANALVYPVIALM